MNQSLRSKYIFTSATITPTGSFTDQNFFPSFSSFEMDLDAVEEIDKLVGNTWMSDKLTVLGLKKISIFMCNLTTLRLVISGRSEAGTSLRSGSGLIPKYFYSVKVLEVNWFITDEETILFNHILKKYKRDYNELTIWQHVAPCKIPSFKDCVATIEKHANVPRAPDTTRIQFNTYNDYWKLVINREL